MRGMERKQREQVGSGCQVGSRGFTERDPYLAP